MRVALFGGTFDPPHCGHLKIAGAAADALKLDLILFAPTGRQPLKQGRTSTSYADRLEMTELACGEDDRFQVSTIDAPQPNGLPNYTVDTLARLQQEMPDAVLFNLVGADSFLDLRRWREPDRLLELAEWIVVSRPGFSLEDLSSLHLTRQQRSRIYLLQNVNEHISATGLRQRLQAGDPCTDLLPATVADYIQARGLYR